MGRGDADVVREFFRAAARRDVERMRTLVDADVRWETTAELPGGGVFHGPAEVERVLREQADAFDDFSVEPEEVREVGGQVVVLARLRGRIRGTDAELDARVGQLWTVRGGRVARFRAFLDRQEAVTLAEAEAAA